ncbi:MAG: hypothetical protein RSA99_02970 [Oscillospiraceae bacterium]
MDTIFTEKFLNNFREFLEENFKEKYQCFDFDACLKELEEIESETANGNYELKGYETKSGNPECFGYVVSNKFFDDNQKEVFTQDEIENASYAQTTFVE